MDWSKYLYLPHESYNCLTLIEKICEDQGYSIKGIEDMAQYHFKHNWGNSVSYEEIEKFIQLNRARLVDLSDIDEFDIILFKLRDVRPQHFGVYIGLNRFIHHRKYIKIDELNQDFRDRIKYVIRWKDI
mgnify:FL=1|jgi:cell wall-associated NlpC family hydrolase